MKTYKFPIFRKIQALSISMFIGGSGVLLVLFAAKYIKIIKLISGFSIFLITCWMLFEVHCYLLSEIQVDDKKIVLKTPLLTVEFLWENIGKMVKTYFGGRLLYLKVFEFETKRGIIIDHRISNFQELQNIIISKIGEEKVSIE